MTRKAVLYEVIRTFRQAAGDLPEVSDNQREILEMFDTPGKRFDIQGMADRMKAELSLSSSAVKWHIRKSIKVAMGAGMLRRIPPEDKVSEEFLGLDSVQYWLQQLRGRGTQNMSSVKSTRYLYMRHLWGFHSWLVRRRFKVTRMSSRGDGIFAQEKPEMAFGSVEEMLETFKSPFTVRGDAAKIIKTYLMTEHNSNLSPASKAQIKSAILSYFIKNEYDITVNFDPKTSSIASEENDEQSMSLVQLLHMLTRGQASVLEMAVFLCKFHRGLDVITLLDRFNFHAWEQIVGHFGSENHDVWDLGKCPVPVTLTRVKTGYRHTGFLERDAVEALQKYLAYREEQTGGPMGKDKPLFINKYGRPLNRMWVFEHFNTLSTKSGVRRVISNRGAHKKYNLDSHEMRDLLKSTLIDSKCRMDVADHCIGHKPKDSYEKQAILYPETLRSEYAKAAERLNIFSRVESAVAGSGGSEMRNLMLERRISEMEKEMENGRGVAAGRHRDRSRMDSLEEETRESKEMIREMAATIAELKRRLPEAPLVETGA